MNLGFCSTRVLSTGLICGQAVGVAAGLAKRYSKLPRAIAADHAKESQQILLRQDAPHSGCRERGPEGPLARAATASASSEAPLELAGAEDGARTHRPRRGFFPVSGNRIDTVSLWLASRSTEPFEMQISLAFCPEVWDFRATDDIATAKATIAAGHKGWGISRSTATLSLEGCIG